MATKSVILGQKTGDGADVLLPHTSADLVGYENADVAGVTDVAAALDNLFEGAVGDVSSLAGRVDALETEQDAQDANISALAANVTAAQSAADTAKTTANTAKTTADAANAAAADWTASKPGIVQRVEALETKVVPISRGGTGNTVGTAVNATKWNGAAKTVSAAAAAGGANGDIWFQY